MPGACWKCVIVCAVAAVAAGCSGSNPLLEKETYTSLFSTPPKLFDASDFKLPNLSKDTVSLGPSGPVGAEELVTADGACAAPAAPTAASETRAASAPQADRPVGTLAGDLAGAPMPAGASAASQPPAPPPDRLLPEGTVVGTPPALIGGVALGMTECQVVRRAGRPSNVAISPDAKGERKVVLTYAGGGWPGVYTFEAGRLQVIEGLPSQAQAEKPKSRPRPAAGASTQRTAGGYVYVQ